MAHQNILTFCTFYTNINVEEYLEAVMSKY